MFGKNKKHNPENEQARRELERFATEDHSELTDWQVCGEMFYLRRWERESYDDPDAWVEKDEGW